MNHGTHSRRHESESRVEDAPSQEKDPTMFSLYSRSAPSQFDRIDLDPDLARLVERIDAEFPEPPEIRSNLPWQWAEVLDWEDLDEDWGWAHRFHDLILDLRQRVNSRDQALSLWGAVLRPKLKLHAGPDAHVDWSDQFSRTPEWLEVASRHLFDLLLEPWLEEASQSAASDSDGRRERVVVPAMVTEAPATSESAG